MAHKTVFNHKIIDRQSVVTRALRLICIVLAEDPVGGAFFIAFQINACAHKRQAFHIRLALQQGKERHIDIKRLQLNHHGSCATFKIGERYIRNRQRGRWQ